MSNKMSFILISSVFVTLIFQEALAINCINCQSQMIAENINSNTCLYNKRDTGVSCKNESFCFTEILNEKVVKGCAPNENYCLGKNNCAVCKEDLCNAGKNGSTIANISFLSIIALTVAFFCGH